MRGERLPEQEQRRRPRPRSARSPSALARISTACRVPAQITIESGEVRTPRTRPRYSASASRSSMRPRGSPIRSASVGAVGSARRVEASHARAGNARDVGRAGHQVVGRHAGGAARAGRQRRRPPRRPPRCPRPAATPASPRRPVRRRPRRRCCGPIRDRRRACATAAAWCPTASRPDRTASRSAVISSSRAPRAPGVMACAQVEVQVARARIGP